ncbi:MAG TPA: hypothetical protein VFV05_05360 [Methylomirabilota bacterium]|nr:hypothetical protein [Methylomirabilota bacterium]
MISDDHRDHRLTDTPAPDELPVATRPFRARDARPGRRLVWPLVRGMMGLVVLALVGVATLILWPLMSPPNPDASVQLVDGRMIGETTGYVARIDRAGHTVTVSASLLGLSPVVLIVNGETVITVRDRQGGFGDLWRDLPVRVSYEVRGDTRFARSIEVLTADAGTPPGSADRAPLPAATGPPAVAPPAVPGSPAVEAPARRGAAAPPRATGRSATAEPPRRPASPSVTDPRSATPQPGVENRPGDVPPPPANDRADADVPDGTAAIDWLIRGSRRE